MGKSTSTDGDVSSLTTAIIDTIRSSKNGKSMELKELRKAALKKSDLDDNDKSSKKLFKEAIKSLEKEEKVSLSAEGIVKLSKSQRTKSKGESTEKEEEVDGPTSSDKKKKKKKDKKRKRESKVGNDDDDDDDEKSKKKKQIDTNESHHDAEEQNATTHEEEDAENIGVNNIDAISSDNNNKNDSNDDPKDKNKPCKGNPQGITRLFLGNLPFAISEPTLNTHLNDCVTHIKWITDKETGKFYGSAFCEVRNSKDAARTLSEVNGTKLMGRPIKINYAPVRPGEEKDWPPRSKVITGGKVANAGKGGQAGGSGIKAMSVKPEGCCKLFIGNLSYDIDDEAITKFFMGVEAECKAVRWLYHRDSGDFKGCGYVDFWSTEACEKAATLNGKNLLGRPIRIDWTD